MARCAVGGLERNGGPESRKMAQMDGGHTRQSSAATHPCGDLNSRSGHKTVGMGRKYVWVNIDSRPWKYLHRQRLVTALHPPPMSCRANDGKGRRAGGSDSSPVRRHFGHSGRPAFSLAKTV
jgi:hypothetical protein